MIRQLLSRSEEEVDSIVVSGVFVLLIFCGLAILAVVHSGAFDATGFGTGAAAIIGAGGFGKAARDWNKPNGNDPSNPPTDRTV